MFSVLAYCVGSISCAVLVCQLAELPDPRTAGSQNPGTTNVLRLGGKKVAIATLVGDALKGVVPVYIAMLINPMPAFIGTVMVAVFLGHLYPVFFEFKGGKGVATAVGVLFALSWPIGFMALGTWLLIALCFRISSLAALAAAFLAPFYTWWWLNIQFAIPVLIMTLFIFWRHKENLKRIIAKTEPKININKKAEVQTP